MKKNTIKSVVELSYEESKCLEVHLRQLQKEAVVHTLKHTPGKIVLLLVKMISTLRSTDQLKSAKAEP